MMDTMEYLIQESEYVRQSILPLINNLQALERYALLTTGVIWSWAATNSQSPGVRLLYWLPLLIQVLLGIRALVTWKSLYAQIKYLSQLERKIIGEEPYGLGTYLIHEWGNLAERSGTLFWYTLWGITTLINLIIAFIS